MIEEKVAIVDSDLHRRCDVSRYFYDHALHVEPFESLAELRASWPKVGLMLVHYDQDGLREVFDAMSEGDCWIPTVVYSSDPEPAQIVDAVLMGAMDFLAWPFSAEHLKARLKILLARRRSFAELRRKAARAQTLVNLLSRREKDVLFSMAR